MVWLKLQLYHFYVHFIFYLLIYMGGGHSHQGHVFSSPIPGTKTPGFSEIYRNSTYPDKLTDSPSEGIRNMKDVVIKSCKHKFPKKNFIGQILLKGPGENGVDERELIKFTYEQVFQMSENLGSSIVSQGLQYHEKLHGMKLIGIYSKNRYEWMVSDIACMLYGLTLVPLYDTLGIENLTYCLENSEMSSCFVTESTIQTLLKLKGHGNLKNIISFDPLSKQIQQQLYNHGFNLLYFSEFIKKQDKHVDHSSINPSPQSCITFSYTSGTTGPPKGAMLCHRNFTAFLAAFQKSQIQGFKENDVYVSFLPLPHVFQRVVQAGIMYFGAFSVFFNGDVTKLKDDCAFIKPTVFIGVPRIFNKIHEGVQKKFSEATGLSKCLVNGGVKSKTQTLKSSGKFNSGFYDSLVFSKTKAGFGGNVRMMITGSAPIRPEVFEFMKIIMCCPFYEGYGQTENTAAAFITSTYDSEIGHVGGVVTDLQFKLADIPEMNYTCNDKDDQGRSTPRGEIWLRGPGVFLGYYKQDDKTKQAITHDGWLKTGDVGMLLPGSRAMKIIDRKKNIFKLQQGQYVASEKVEAIYASSHLVSEAFLHGESTHNYAVAIITVDKAQLMKIAQNHKISGTFEQICQNKQMRTLVCKELISVGKKQGLHGFEQAKNLHIEPKTFQQIGVLTNTLKLQRFAAKQHYANQIKQMYEEGELNLK